MKFKQATDSVDKLKPNGRPKLTVKLKSGEYIEIDGSLIFFDKFHMGEAILHVSSDKKVNIHLKNKVESKSKLTSERVKRIDKDVIIVTRSLKKPTDKL